MVQFIEDRRKLKRLRKLKESPGSDKPMAVGKSGKGNAYQHTNTGYRPDLKVIARSNWEANTLRILEVHGIKWLFEPKTFHYPIQRGVKSYMPDIFLVEGEEWIEVKGWLDNRSKTKLKRFKKYYPEEFSKLTMIISKGSKMAKKFCEDIEVPNVVYYEDLQNSYKTLIGTHWQGR